VGGTNWGLIEFVGGTNWGLWRAGRKSEKSFSPVTRRVTGGLDDGLRWG